MQSNLFKVLQMYPLNNIAIVIIKGVLQCLNAHFCSCNYTFPYEPNSFLKLHLFTNHPTCVNSINYISRKFVSKKYQFYFYGGNIFMN